jgi:putative hydrolase of the HAD superfamily
LGWASGAFLKARTGPISGASSTLRKKGQIPVNDSALRDNAQSRVTVFGHLKSRPASAGSFRAQLRFRPADCTANIYAAHHVFSVGAMKKAPAITCVFVDIGGVLLTNGWDHHARRRAVAKFKLDWAEMEERHRLTFEIHEEGKLTFEEYLSLVVFYEKRPFTRAQFRRFMCEQSKPYLDTIGTIAQLKARHGMKIAVVSNESLELNAYRIRTFKLDGFVDSFISSCFVHLRKPDVNIFRLALDITHTQPHQVLYIENTPMFVRIAQGLGIRSILHTDYESTRAQLASLGLNEGDPQ